MAALILITTSCAEVGIVFNDQLEEVFQLLFEDPSQMFVCADTWEAEFNIKRNNSAAMETIYAELVFLVRFSWISMLLCSTALLLSDR